MAGYKISRRNIEAVALIIFILVFCYFGLANMWGREISHDMPYSYLASDSFLHFSIAEYAMDNGRFKYAPPYDVGGHEGVLEMHPPFLAVTTIMISEISGMKTYDAIYLTAVILTLFGILAFYILNRGYNKDVALLSLPAALLIFSRLFNMMLFWGIWYFATGVALMIGTAYFIPRIKERYAFVFFGILYGALVIAHIPEAIYLVGFIAVYLILEMIKRKKLILDNAKYLLMGGILGSFLAMFYINVFRNTALAVEGFRGTPAGGYFGFPNIFIIHLGIVGIIFLIGFVFHLLAKKRFSYPVLFGLFFFGVSYLTYFGFGKRAFVHRFFWHTYLGIFFGMAIFYLVKLVVKKWNPAYTLVLFMVVLSTIVVAYKIDATTKTGPGLMDPYNWQGLMWLRKNAGNDVPVFYFYTDALSQAAALYSSHHVSFKVGTNNLTKSIQSGRLYQRYSFGLADSQSPLACELGFLKVGYYRNIYRPDSLEYECEEGNQRQVPAPHNFWLCDLEYVYFNKFSGNQALAAYSMEIANILLKAPWINKAYENELVLILHNEKPGEDCIEDNTAA
ncbi:hypothetical protein KY366_01790 [Candidatus Woesearchaeota archaeon]|nr:hypothetical protein [Candidatus Woesearchaeota archaeon]